MKNTDMPMFVKLLTAVCAVYDKAVCEFLIESYWRALQRFELAVLRQAFQAHMDNTEKGEFMPKPSQIVALIEGNAESKALHAWHKVIQAIQRVGSYDSVVFDDPLIHVCVMDLGGWIFLCQRDTYTLAFIGKQFERIYKSYLHLKPTRYPRQLIGQLEQQNQEAGTVSRITRFLGDAVKALQVWRNGCEPKDYVRPYAGITMESESFPSISNEAENNRAISEDKTSLRLAIYSGDNTHEH